MKSALIFILLCAGLRITAAEGTVLVGGKLKTIAEVEQVILKHARKHRIEFDFDGAPREFRTYTNRSIAIAMFSFHPKDGSLFIGELEHSGRIHCDWAATLGPKTANAMVPIRGKLKTVVEVERLVLEHAREQQVPFDFEGAERSFSIMTRPSGVSITFEHSGVVPYCAYVDRKGQVSGQFMFICGTPGITNVQEH